MADSTLLHGEESPPATTKGHGTAALGPSDSSDSGSDIQGGPGLNRDDGLMQPAGTTSDPDVDEAGTTAGPDIGDANLDSDSDRNGTGERAAAGRDSTLATDQVLRDIDTGEPVDPETMGDEAEGGGAAPDEIVGGGDRPVTAGQYVTPDAPYGTRPRGGREPGERDHGRADGKHVDGRDDVPVFDRAGREDLPK